METNKIQATQEVLEVLANCTTEKNLLTLPTLERDVYQRVAKVLDAFGGKWTRRLQAICFAPDVDAETIVQRILKGEDINPRKTYQFFPTPAAVAAQMLDLIDINGDHYVLEPSAGDGALIQAIHHQCPTAFVDCYEAWDENRAKLERMERVVMLGDDFLQARPEDGKYDRIVANPPFAQNQDIKHVLHMLRLLKPGGKLVTVMSKHWQFAGDALSIRFRKFVEGMSDCLRVIELPAGEFKESGTNVPTCLLIFND